MHTAKVMGAFVEGINLDPSQIEDARGFTKRIGLERKTAFKVGSLNDPLPYEDESFDAAYNIQSFLWRVEQRLHVALSSLDLVQRVQQYCYLSTQRDLIYPPTIHHGSPNCCKVHHQEGCLPETHSQKDQKNHRCLHKPKRS